MQLLPVQKASIDGTPNVAAAPCTVEGREGKGHYHSTVTIRLF